MAFDSLKISGTARLSHVWDFAENGSPGNKFFYLATDRVGPKHLELVQGLSNIVVVEHLAPSMRDQVPLSLLGSQEFIGIDGKRKKGVLLSILGRNTDGRLKGRQI